MDNLFELADKLRALREEKETQTAVLKGITSDINEIEYILSEAMAENECTNFTRRGKQFILTTTKRWSPEEDQKDALFALLKKKGHEHLFSINSRTLASFIREQVMETMDEHGEIHVPEWLVGLVKSFEDTGITIRAVTKTAFRR